MAARRIKAIFFDAAGTLFAVNGSVGEIYARLAREHGKDVSIADLESGFRRCYAQTPAMAFPSASPESIPALEKQWWKALVQNVFAPLGSFPEFDTYFDTLFTCFARPESWQLYPEIIETLTTLKDKGFLLGVISNFDSRLFGILEGLGIALFFDSVVISTQAGAAKPDRTIFLQALSSCSLQPHEAAHVGDSYDADIVGAQAAGLEPVLVDRQGSSQSSDTYHNIENLTGLLHLIERER